MVAPHTVAPFDLCVQAVRQSFVSHNYNRCINLYKELKFLSLLYSLPQFLFINFKYPFRAQKCNLSLITALNEMESISTPKAIFLMTDYGHDLTGT